MPGEWVSCPVTAGEPAARVRRESRSAAGTSGAGPEGSLPAPLLLHPQTPMD